MKLDYVLSIANEGIYQEYSIPGNLQRIVIYCNNRFQSFNTTEFGQAMTMADTLGYCAESTYLIEYNEGECSILLFTPDLTMFLKLEQFLMGEPMKITWLP